MSSRENLKTVGLIHSLRHAPIFANLPDDNLQEIANFSHVKKFAKGEYLFYEQQPSIGFYIVRKGMINVHRVASDGREQVIHLFRPGESLAEAAIVSEEGYPANARAVEDSEVILVPKQNFLQQVQADTSLALRMLASMSQHLRILVTSLENLKLKDAETRLLHWLLRRCTQPLSDSPQEIQIGMTKAILACELGTRQETLSRIFAKLRDHGYLLIKRKSIVVSNPQQLQTLFETNMRGHS